MADLRRPGPDADRQDDLDVAAGVYARRWSSAGAEFRTRLREDLIRRCLPLADRMARRHAGRSEPLDDLQQVARIGLIKAIDRYDPGRGSFTAFAVATISGEIKHHLRDRTWSMRVSRRQQDLVLEISHATATLTADLARTPGTAEIAAHLGVTEDAVRAAQASAAGHTALPFSTPVGADGGCELGDLLGGQDPSIEALADRLTVAELVHLLPDRIQQIIAMRFNGNLTQSQIAAELGVSQMQVSRLLSQAFGWLRAAMLSDVPPRWTGADDVRHGDDVRVSTRRTGRVVTVEVVGEVDRDNADRLRLQLHGAVAASSAGEVVLDITRLPMVDAAGAAVLRDARVTAGLAGVPLTYTGTQPAVARVLAVLGVT